MLLKNTLCRVFQMVLVGSLVLTGVETWAQNAGEVPHATGRNAMGRNATGPFKLSALGKSNTLRSGATPTSKSASSDLSHESSRIAAVDEQEVKSTPTFVPARPTSFSRRQEQETAPPAAAFVQPAPQDERKPMQTASRRALLEPVSAIELNIGHKNKKTPEDRSAALFQLNGFEWNQMPGSELSYYWEAPNIRYKKLYFEDVAVERYGQVPCGCWQQTTRATAHWAASLLSLPLKMRLDPYYDCDTPLGYCRPGECVPPTWQRHLYR